jgi:hypothetical protein
MKDDPSNASKSQDSSSCSSTETSDNLSTVATRQPSLLLRKETTSLDDELRQLFNKLSALPIEEDMYQFFAFFYGADKALVFTRRLFKDFQLTNSLNSQTLSVIPAAIAGVTLKDECTWQSARSVAQERPLE